MAPYRKKNEAEPSPILSRNGRSANGTWSVDQMRAIAKISCAVAMKGNASYINPTRFGSVIVKVYIDGQQYAENLNPGDDWDLLAEEIIEALYDLATVGIVRRAFPAAPQEGPGATEEGRPIPRVPRKGSVNPGGSEGP